MSRFSFLVLLVIAALALSGCGNSEDRFVGTYSIKQQLSKQGEALNTKTAPKADQQKQLEQAQVSLTLNKDKTASMTLAGMPGTAPTSINGVWEFKDQVVMVSLVQADTGKPGLPMALVPSDDGKSLTSDSTFGSMTLMKE